MNKAAIKRLALELRAEISLGPYDRFDPYHLAEQYGVAVIPLSALACTPVARAHFESVRPEVFSGASIPDGAGGTAIVENDVHPLRRRRNTVSHEMAHVVLEHTFSPRFTDERGCYLGSPEQEAEATELAGELLITFQAAKRLAVRGATDEDAAAEFDVSVELARWRLNSTGARLIATRWRRRSPPRQVAAQR